MHKYKEETRKKIEKIVFEYGVGMVSDQTALFMGAITVEEAEISQGRKTADAINQLTSLLTQE